MTTIRRWVFSVVLVGLAALTVGLFVEMALRLKASQVAESNRLDPGMFRHDANLGWELVPGWEGGHRHYDYDVSYRINRLGFRADTGAAESRPDPKIAVLGDSFTFGFGVADDETFVHLLDREVRPDGCVVNFAVPGTSTDQQALLLERRVLKLRPSAVLVVVYLGNDLVDNQLSYPAQASNAKPLFKLKEDGLVLQNVPVPAQSRPLSDPQGRLRRAILGDDPTAEPPGRFALAGKVLGAVEPDYRAQIETQLVPAMALFQAIIRRAHTACAEEGVPLALALMPGKSHLESPDSASAQYQEIVRGQIVDWAEKEGIRAMDIASVFRERPAGSADWYFPNEGHLTPAGHQAVAEVLLPTIRELVGADPDLATSRSSGAGLGPSGL